MEEEKEKEFKVISILEGKKYHNLIFYLKKSAGFLKMKCVFRIK